MHNWNSRTKRNRERTGRKIKSNGREFSKIHDRHQTTNTGRLENKEQDKYKRIYSFTYPNQTAENQREILERIEAWHKKKGANSPGRHNIL